MNSEVQKFLDEYEVEETVKSDTLPEGVTWFELAKITGLTKKMVEYEPGIPKARYMITLEGGKQYSVNSQVIDGFKEAKELGVPYVYVKRIGMGKQSKFTIKPKKVKEDA